MHYYFKIEPATSIALIYGWIEEDRVVSEFKSVCSNLNSSNPSEILVDLRNTVVRIGYENYKEILGYLLNQDTSLTSIRKVTILTKNPILEGVINSILTEMDLTGIEVDVVTDPKSYRGHDQKIRSAAGINGISR